MIDHARILLQPAISDALPLKRADHSVLNAKGAPYSIADIYNEAGDGYGAYADGDPTRLFAFEGLHAYADRRLWAVLDAKLLGLRASGATSLAFSTRVRSWYMAKPLGSPRAGTWVHQDFGARL